jgi:hypothetical protein
MKPLQENIAKAIVNIFETGRPRAWLANNSKVIPRRGRSCMK